MVSIALSKIDVAELIFVDSGMKANGQYYRDASFSSCCQRPSMLHSCRRMFVFQQDNAPSRHAKDPIKLLQQETPDFIGPDL